MWNNLHFSNIVDPSTGVASGMYWFTDGIAPNRRLVIEWYKMAYDMDTSPNDVISFNLVLYECQNIIEFIYGYPNVGEVYNESTIGIENLDGTVAVVYDTYVAMPVTSTTTGTTTPVASIVGVAITFSQSPLGTVMVNETNAQGCVPLPTCFKATVDTTIPPCVEAQGGVSTPPSFGFHWVFGDGGEAFTPNVCHTYTVPGDYIFSNTLKTGPTLTVTDQFGNTATTCNNTLEVIACDIPPVIMTVTPQGGTAPLSIDIRCSSTTPYVQSATPPNLSNVIPTISAYDTANTAITIDQLGPQNQPNSTIPIQTLIGGTMSAVPTPRESEHTGGHHRRHRCAGDARHVSSNGCFPGDELYASHDWKGHCICRSHRSQRHHFEFVHHHPIELQHRLGGEDSERAGNSARSGG